MIEPPMINNHELFKMSAMAFSISFGGTLLGGGMITAPVNTESG